MMPERTLSRDWIRQLQTVAMQTGGHFTSLKEKLLRQLMCVRSMNPADLLKYYDLLLAMMAYPENRSLLDLTRSALENLQSEVERIFKEPDHRSQYRLTGSGIKGSLILGSFSYHIAAWLAKNFPED